MGHDNSEIGEQLLTGVVFRPFCCCLGKFWLFIYSIEINKTNLTIKMYQDFELQFSYISTNPNDVWKKVGILQEHKGIDLFGISQSQIQTYIQT
ncbi:hypothetical protein C1645_818075 [Glomus cerebriforme]|uniref:Uncharacterized protein n=1 Tax=Glomus cerebriforme TaxID=658196 RepID=A0A397T7Z4_9GLOM|nr:hypothetical protein C1645_818075 [Glomus cerebriforme]